MAAIRFRIVLITRYHTEKHTRTKHILLLITIYIYVLSFCAINDSAVLKTTVFEKHDFIVHIVGLIIL